MPSRPDFLSFDEAPGEAAGGGAAGPGRMLMSAGHGRVGADRPALALGLITAGPQPVQDLLPGAVQRPVAVPVIDGLPVPELPRQVTPRAARPGAEQDAVDHHPVIGPPPAARRVSRQQRPQALPLLIGQVMAIQVTRHRTDLHDLTTKIHGTRSRRTPLAQL